MIDPLLDVLANNGGPTPTHALMPGSPAINMGDPSASAGMGDTPQFDQRGAPYTRVSGGRIDMGAFEDQPPPSPSADFDSDDDIDGADFLAWQRGSERSPPAPPSPTAMRITTMTSTAMIWTSGKSIRNRRGDGRCYIICSPDQSRVGRRLVQCNDVSLG